MKLNSEIDQVKEKLIFENHFQLKSKRLKVWSMISSLLFDLVLGILFSALIYFVSYKIFTKYLIELTNWSDWLKVTIEWMMGFPYGFKPNKELDSFLGGCMISLLDGWKAMIRNLILYYGEMLMKVILLIGIMFGFTI